MSTIIHQLKLQRKALRLTQTEVASRAKVSRSQYQHIENGRHAPSIELFQRIAEALELEVVLISKSGGGE